jgi:hypothetical protein
MNLVVSNVNDPTPIVTTKGWNATTDVTNLGNNMQKMEVCIATQVPLEVVPQIMNI